MQTEESELLKKYNNIYLEIITRYKDYIEENEGLSVANLPKLVTPEDETVQMVARSIKEKFPLYKYDDNFYDAAKLAAEYVRSSIAPISLPFQFWLKPSETIRYEAGDKFDKVTLLCSLLLALGSTTAKAIIVNKDSTTSFYVDFEWNSKLAVIDLDKGISEYADAASMTKEFGISGSDEGSAYEFNDKLYNDLA